jgi:trigger factor
VLGSGSFIPGFEDQLIGVKAGDELDVKVTFPENYQAADLAGKEAVFETKVHEVQSAKDADIDDALAEKFGMENLDKLKEVIKEQLENEHSGQSRMKLKRAILDELDKGHKFDLPPGMVEAEFNSIWTQVQAEKEAGQLDEEDKKKTEKQLEKDYRKIAERRVRLGLVLAEMGQVAEIQISNDELQQAMIAEARQYPGQEQQVIEFYQKNPNAIAQLRAPIYEEKVVDLIIEKSKVTDKKVKKEKLFEEDDVI